MGQILLEFVQSGGLMAVLLLFFLIGFVLKIVAGLCYDGALEDIHCVKIAKNGIVSDIISRYSFDLNSGKKIRNTKAYVENELHQWKKYGIRVERMEQLGDLFGGICMAACVFFDMLLLIRKTSVDNGSGDIMRYVYVYSTVTIIFFLVLKLWSMVTYTANKRKILADGLINYMDNQLENLPEYVTLNHIPLDSGKTEGKEREKRSNTDNSEEDNIQPDSESGKEKQPLKKEDKELVIAQVLDEFLV